MFDFNDARPLSEWEWGAAPQDTIPEDPVQAFLGEMAKFDLSPGALDIDGVLHRFDTDKRGDKAGWYVFYQGDICAGAFGDWKTGLSEKWCSKDIARLTYAERTIHLDRMRQAQESRERQEGVNQENSRKKAIDTWDNAGPVMDHDHPYLKRKGVKSYHLRVDQSGNLLVPMLDENLNIWNVERVPQGEGKKKGLLGGRRKGLFFLFDGTDQIALCEGYSTGASIHAITGATVYCSFNAGNLPDVARVIKERQPGKSIIVAADNDKYKPEKGNAGITKAKEAAAILGGCPVVWPTFVNEDSKPTDFNDLLTLEGPDTVRAQLADFNKTYEYPALTEASTKLAGMVKKRPRNIDFVLTINGKGFLPRGVVGVLAATGGTGKTFFLLRLAVALAGGGSFGPIRAPKPVKTLVVCGEDDKEEVIRRAWDMCQGKFPEKLHAASVYGAVGPLMELDRNKPIRSKGFFWLEETIKGHPGLEFLILDPKSRFYGLDENSNDHATQWISCLEYLSKEYGLTILFSAHTSEANAGRISQAMNRGASAIVDGCRWQAGLIRMDQETADRYGIEDRRKYVVLDVPKSNYAMDLPAPIYFTRGETGVIEHTEPGKGRLDEMGFFLLELIESDPREYTRNELIKMPVGSGIAKDMKDNFPNFVRSKDMASTIDWLLKSKSLQTQLINHGRNAKEILVPAEGK